MLFFLSTSLKHYVIKFCSMYHYYVTLRDLHSHWEKHLRNRPFSGGP